MEIVSPEIETYMGEIYGERHRVLREMEAEAEKRDFPIVGPLVGKLFFQLAKMTGARRVFEMGSGYGYSALWWALGMEGGEVICAEGSESNKSSGEKYLKKAGLLDKVKYHIGDALEIIDGVRGKFDIVFIDIEKRDYPRALRKAVPRVKKGGLIVADNVLWSGKVVESRGDESTEGIKEFNRLLFSLKEFSRSIIPVRDGVAVAYKV